MKLNKKIMLGLGAITAVAVPVVAVVACAPTAKSWRNNHEMHDTQWMHEHNYHYVETKTEYLAFTISHKDHITYEVYVNDDGKKAYHEIG